MRNTKESHITSPVNLNVYIYIANTKILVKSKFLRWYLCYNVFSSQQAKSTYMNTKQ